MVVPLDQVSDIFWMKEFRRKYHEDLNRPLEENFYIEKVDEISATVNYSFAEDLMNTCLPKDIKMNEKYPLIEVVKFLDTQPHRDLDTGEWLLVVPVKLSSLDSHWYLGYEDFTSSSYEFEIQPFHRYLLNQISLHWVEGLNYLDRKTDFTLEIGLDFNMVILFNIEPPIPYIT